MPITETVELSLKPDAKIGDPDNEASTRVQTTCQTLTSSGATSVYFGTVYENASKLRLFINWPSLEVHQQFMNSDKYSGFLANIKPMLTGPPKIFHVYFGEGVDKALTAPITEITTLYFDGEPPSDVKDIVTNVGSLASQVPAIEAVASGVSHEILEAEGVKGKAVVLAIGWSSYDAHMEARQTTIGKEIRPMLMKASKTATSQHVQAMHFVPE